MASHSACQQADEPTKPAVSVMAERGGFLVEDIIFEVGSVGYGLSFFSLVGLLYGNQLLRVICLKMDLCVRMNTSITTHRYTENSPLLHILWG